MAVDESIDFLDISRINRTKKIHKPKHRFKSEDLVL